MKLFSVFILCFVVASINAQVAITPVKKSYTDSEGNLFWNKEKPVYLHISDSPEDAGQLLKSKKSAAYTNPVYLDTEGINYIRTRYAVDTLTKKTILPHQEVLWEIYADGTAAKSDLLFPNNASYTVKDSVFYGTNLIGEITSKDALSGVANTFYSVNGSKFKKYTQAVSFPQKGDYTVRYYSTDQVGNLEITRVKKFTVDTKAPKTFYTINGFSEEKIIGASSKIYLTAEDDASGIAKTYYKFNNEEFKVYQGKNIPFNYLKDGNQTLYFYSVDHVGNKEVAKSLEFYFDKSAPILAADILGDRFIANDKVYFSGRTKLKLTSVDNKSGVKDVFYSINNKKFISYTTPFYLPSISGEHRIKYYSSDNMNNVTHSKDTGKYEEFKHSVSKVYIDLNGPTLSYKYLGASFKKRDTILIAPNTRIKLIGNDPESGLSNINYSIDGNMEEIKYTEPFTVTKNGLHTIEIFGYDNVNNRNISSFNFIVEGVAPHVFYNFSSEPIKQKDGIPVYANYTILYLGATDAEVGVNSLTYKMNNAAQKTYTTPIKYFKKGKKYDITVEAKDHLGNSSSQNISFYVE